MTARMLPALLILLILASAAAAGETKPAPKRPAPSVADPEWQAYSLGLFYQNRGDYNRAVTHYLDAVLYGKSLDRIYFHIGECYYHLNDYDNALNYLNLSINADKQFIEPYLLISTIFHKLKNYESSADILEKILDLKPGLVDIHFRLGLIYYLNIKNFEKSMVFFRNIEEIGKTVPVESYYLEHSHYYMGSIAYYRNDTETAIAEFRKTFEINPNNQSALYMLGALHMQSYQLDIARKYIRHYLMRYPGNKRMNSMMGRILYLEGDHMAAHYLRKGISGKSLDGVLAEALYLEIDEKDALAKTRLQEIIEKYPIFISTHIGLGKIALRSGDRLTAFREYFTAGILLYKTKQYDRARECFAKVLSIDDTVPEVYLYLARTCEESDNIFLAIYNYKKALALNPQTDLVIHLGYLHSLKKNIKQSVLYFDRAIKEDPGNPKPYFVKGIAYSLNDRNAMAEKYLRKALHLKENDTYYFYLATVQEKQKKLNAAITSLKNAIRFNLNNARAHNFLGYLYADNNINLHESIKLIERALSIDPSNGAYLDSLGWAYFKLGRYNDALKKLLEAEKQLEKTNTPDAVVFDHIAQTYRKLNNSGKAIEYWEKSLKIEKNGRILRELNILSKKSVKRETRR